MNIDYEIGELAFDFSQIALNIESFYNKSILI
jgi:hypothetical protein